MQYCNNQWLSNCFTTDKSHWSNFCLNQSLCWLTDLGLGKLGHQWVQAGFGARGDAYGAKLPAILRLSRNRSRCPMSPRCCPPGRQSVRKMPSLCPVWKGLYWGRKKRGNVFTGCVTISFGFMGSNVCIIFCCSEGKYCQLLWLLAKILVTLLCK